MRVLIAGGGTGGHIYPGIAIADCLQNRNIISDFACTQRSIDSKILSANKELFGEIIVQPITPVSVNPVELMKFVRNFAASRKLIKDYLRKYEDVRAVVGLGGFGSVVGVMEAHKRGIKTAILNPDFVPGRANRLCQKYADKIFVQWPASQQFFKKQAEAIGVPLRNSICEITAVNKRTESRKLAIDEFRKYLAKLKVVGR